MLVQNLFYWWAERGLNDLEEEKNQGPDTGFVICLKINKSLMMLVSMNQSPKARMPLEERIQTEFLHIWKWGPGSGSQGTDWCAGSLEVLPEQPICKSVGLSALPFFLSHPQIQLRKPCITGDWEFCKSKGAEDRNQELENLDGKGSFCVHQPLTET